MLLLEGGSVTRPLTTTLSLSKESKTTIQTLTRLHDHHGLYLYITSLFIRCSRVQSIQFRVQSRVFSLDHHDGSRIKRGCLGPKASNQETER